MDLVIFLPLLIVLGAFMFFASRRQKKAMQATIDLHGSLAVGDRVHTTSGMQGTIVGITDDNVELEIAPGVVTTWMKLAVRDRIAEVLDDDEDDVYDDDADTTNTNGTIDTNGTNNYAEHSTTGADVAESPGVTEAAADPDRSKRD